MSVYGKAVPIVVAKTKERFPFLTKKATEKLVRFIVRTYFDTAYTVWQENPYA